MTLRPRMLVHGGDAAALAITLACATACQADAERSYDCMGKPKATPTTAAHKVNPPGHQKHGITYYVRTDGGDASQCDGRADVGYPGSGSNLACAWRNPNEALPPTGPARIAGGDTLLIDGGTYLIGIGGFMQPIPSGPVKKSPTRFLGKPGERVVLIGTNAVHRVLNLDGSSNIEIGNLEITDQSDCVYRHSVVAVACLPGGAWGQVGLYARASHDVWMHDVNIHGMAARGMKAGGLTDWTMEHIKLNRNGTAGWDGNIGSGGSNAGQITLRNIEIGWNGCGERWQTGEAWACWAQQTGGYGDGLGTTTTGGQWLIEDAFVHHNTSDGLDLRYMDGADTTRVTLRRVYAVANAGNQVKVKGNSLIENSVLVGQCGYFQGSFFMQPGDLCRSDGSTLQLVLTGNDLAVVRHDTLAGEGAAQIGYSEGDSTDRIYIQNNTVVGFPYLANPGTVSRFSSGNTKAVKNFSGNLAWNVRSCPPHTTCDENPRLTDMALASFDAAPLPDSPVIDKAPTIVDVTNDFALDKRPSGAANDIGAYEYSLNPCRP